MKGVIALLLICVALFATISQARPVVDTYNQQQKDSSISSSTKNPDFFFHWWFRLPPWFHPHPWPISPSPHGAPNHPEFPKFPFPFPFPWVPGPKGSKKPDELEAASSGLESSSEGTKNPDFFFGWRRLWFWWWITHHGHPSSPAPHGAPKSAGHNLIPLPSKGGAGLEASVDIGDHNINDGDVVDEKCWSPLVKVENCVDDIMGAFSSGNIEIKPACCSVIKKLKSNSCLEKTIGSFNNHRFTTAVTDHCSAI